MWSLQRCLNREKIKSIDKKDFVVVVVVDVVAIPKINKKKYQQSRNNN